MDVTNAEIIDAVIADEGGARFTNNPADPGKATKFGITARGLAPFWNRTPTTEEIAALTLEEAHTFYGLLLTSTKIDRVAHETLRWLVFDLAVQAGERVAVRALQAALGVKVDGVLGPKTLTAESYLAETKLCRLFNIEAMLFFARLAANNLTDADKDGIPDQLEFTVGRLERVARKMRLLA